METQTAKKNKTNQGNQSQENLRQESKVFPAMVWYSVLEIADRDHVIQIFSIFNDFCLLLLPVTEKSVLRPPTVISDLSLSLFGFHSFCFVLKILLLGACTFKIIVSPVG